MAEDVLLSELQVASDCIRRGNLALAEIICRNILQQVPDCGQASAMLGVIAANLRLRDFAIGHFERAIEVEPTLASAHEHLRRVLEMPAQRFDQDFGQSAKRFLLIKSWGFGFWADMFHVLGALLLAEITNRVPVTAWGRNSLYSVGTKDAFRTFFEPISAFDLDAVLELEDLTLFPPKWKLANLHTDDNAKAFGNFARIGGLYLLNRPESMVVSDYYFSVVDIAPWIPGDHPLHGKSVDDLLRHLIGKYLRPTADILSAVQKFDLGDGPTIAVHVRGGGKLNGIEYPDIAAVNQTYRQHLASIDKSWRILLLTDDARLADAYRKDFGSRILLTEAQRSVGFEEMFIHGDRSTTGFEIMRDTYLALRCDRFLGNGQSGVSAAISLLKPWAPGACTLLKPPAFLHLQNRYIYDPSFTAAL